MLYQGAVERSVQCRLGSGEDLLYINRRYVYRSFAAATDGIEKIHDKLNDSYYDFGVAEMVVVEDMVDYLFNDEISKEWLPMTGRIYSVFCENWKYDVSLNQTIKLLERVNWVREGF
jgi:hypothetical protein